MYRANVKRRNKWMAQFIGYTPEAEGCLLSGGSTGNLVGLAVARTQIVLAIPEDDAEGASAAPLGAAGVL